MVKRPVRPAVAAIFVCDGDVFTVRRQPHLHAFPGYRAFPGGKINRDERTTAIDVPWLRDHEALLVQALCRELKEELAFDLEGAIRDGLVTDCIKLCTATTPAFQSLRFHTHFFRVDLVEKPAFKPDEREAAAWFWQAPADLVAQFREGRLLIVPPLRRVIEILNVEPDCRYIDNVDLVYDEEQELCSLEFISQIYQIPVLSNTLPPADRTNAFVIGDLLIDPSPSSEAELERLLRTVRTFTLSGVFLTHHHGDHHERAPAVARRLGLPIYLSADTLRRINEKRGGAYFNGIETHIVCEGQVATHWLGRPVVIHAVPGHDEGQLALAPETLEWFLVGDLIQGIGSVVIAEPEGHMGRYFASLEKVITLDPAVIMPSHGIAMGTSFRLKATLAHRRQREAEVLALAQRRCPEDEMLAKIYPGLDPRLMPLARANIRAHLGKLREEGKLVPKLCDSCG